MSLPTSRLIEVSVNLTPAGAVAQSLSTLLMLGSSPVIDMVERYRDYASLTEVAADFASNTPEYLGAVLWFEQVPQPAILKIGRWAKTAASGVLRGAPLSGAQQLLSNFTGVTSGGFTYTKDGGAATNVTGINLSGATNLNAVAALITAALTGATMTYNATYQRFELTSTTTGDTSAISFLTAPGTGTNIAPLLAMQSTDSGAYVAAGAAVETALECVQFFDLNFGQTWYAVSIVAAPTQGDHLTVAPFIEACENKHVYGVSTQEAGALVAATTTDIAYLLKQLAYKKTVVNFSSSNPYSVISFLGRALTVDYTGNNTVITLMYKSLPGIVAESINSVQADSLKAKNCNAFANFDNGTAIVLNGVTSSGLFLDTITGTDWLAITLQQACYNTLYTSPTRVPQTDAGMHLLVVTCESVCSQAVQNGLLAPGKWNSAGFGTLNQGDFLVKGFYVFADAISSQSQSDRAQRKSVPIRIAAKLAGAVHEIAVGVTVNQ